MSTEPLYPFQSAAVARAAKGEQVYLGFDPGLGKSRTALEIATHRRAKRVLVICPASGRYVWESRNPQVDRHDRPHRSPDPQDLAPAEGSTASS